jgi:hypothetical protein
MAHVKLLERPAKLVRLTYLVDAVVGRGGVNRRDDVLLVQFFLNTLWGTKPDKQTVFGGNGPAPRIDGDCGPETINAITVFQRWYWQTPDPGGFADGRVEPLPPGRMFGPLRNMPYTIIGLNANYGSEFGPDRHAMLIKEPNFPNDLKPKLFVSN